MPTDAPPTPDDEREMTFAGFVALRDPIKPGIVQTVQDLRDAGIDLKIVTGDNRYVAAAVAKSVGLDGRRVVVGSDLDGLDAVHIGAMADGTDVFAEMAPEQKESVIRALRQAGRGVGYLGDGVNDAPSLHLADVGISVDSDANVAKSSASIILLEKDLSVLVDGVRLGRRTFANTFKYIYLTVSASFGNMISMAGATLVLPFLPLLPLQILLINFLSDLPCMAIATDKVDPELIRRPERWDLGFVKRFMLLFGPLSSVFDVTTFVVLRAGWHASPERFRSGWFTESVIAELAMIFVLRTRPFFRSRPSLLLGARAAVVAVVALLLPVTALGGVFGVESLPAGLLATLALIVVACVAVNEIAKRLFYGREAARGAHIGQDAVPHPSG
ncbi:MAG: HAD-IC family P-type ATPase [Thermomicrobiales bacterium]